MEEQPLLSPLITTPASLKTERRKRRDQFARQTVSHSHAAELIEDGWQLDRKLKMRTRVKREKSIDEDLENRVWVLCSDLGFPELNSGRQFKIRFQRSSKIEGEKQIDVFAKDDETIIVAECKASAEIKKRSLQKDIEEMANLKGKIASSIKKHYGSDFKPKIIWAMVTEKIIWSAEDRKRAEGENIAVVTERELRYFTELAKHLGPAGRYQFLAHFLQGQKVPTLENRKIPAIRGKLGGQTFYAFVTTPERLLKVSFVNHRTLNDPRGIPTYQRLIAKNRIRRIHSFLEGGGFFPTNIIVNFVAKPRFDVKLKEDEAGIHFGTLYLPDKYKSAWVIDGQHRLYGFSRLPELQKTQNVMVLAFQQMSHEEEANLFVTINHEQKTVPRTLLADLQGELKWGSEDPRERVVAMCSRLVNVLNGEIGGPFHQRVVQTGLRGTRETCLTIPALVDGLKRSKLIGSVHKKLKTYDPGPFTGKDDFETLDRARHTLEDLFSVIKEANSPIWRDGADGAVCTNTGVAALMMVISEAIDHYERASKLDPKELEPQELALAVQEYLEPIISRLKTGTSAEIHRLFKENVPYGSRGPKELFLKLVGVVRENKPNFGPDDFDKWMTEQNQERAKDAADKVQELNAAICAVVFDKFRQVYGDDLYWDKGVTHKQMRTDAYGRMQDDEPDQRGRIEEYLTLIEFKKVVEKSDHWKLFSDIFSIKMTGEKSGQAKYLKWMDKLNDIRKKTAHKAHGRPLGEDEIEFVDWVHNEFLHRASKSPSKPVKESA